MHTEFRLASIFSDHMVLCRDRNIRIFGEADTGTAITVHLGAGTAEALAAYGKFEAVLPPMEAGGPYTLSVSGGGETLTFADVMIGDVYFAGGQSNMAMKLETSRDGARFVTETNEPEIRYCSFPVQVYLDEETLQKERQTGWKPLTDGRCGDISAVAFHFARRLHRQLRIPIGIIGCAMGGTPIACWLDEHALRSVTGGAAILDGYRERTYGQTNEQYEDECRRHKLRFEAWNQAADAVKQENPSVSAAELTARLGSVPWPPPEGYRYIHRPCGLAETMVKRIAPYTITAFLYYQGETDADHPQFYRELLTALISFWRELFRDHSLPFLMVQLPMFALQEERTPNSWALIRHAQDLVCRDMRGTGLVCMIDTGEADELHPIDKQAVGERLCLQALQIVYGRQAEGDSPCAVSARPQDGAMLVTVSAPLRAVKRPGLFEVAGADGVFQPAEAAVEGTAIRLTNAAVDYPRQARYAWVNYGQVAVFGENGLPLMPFILS